MVKVIDLLKEKKFLDKTELRFVCSECGKRNKHKKGVEKHIRRVH